MEVVKAVYPSLPENLHMAAAQNTVLVLDLLESQGEVERREEERAGCGGEHEHGKRKEEKEGRDGEERGKGKSGCGDCDRIARNQYDGKFIVSRTLQTHRKSLSCIRLFCLPTVRFIDMVHKRQYRITTARSTNSSVAASSL
jgi:hypothetical protein